MKKFLKISGILAILIAIVALVLVMLTPALEYVGNNSTYTVSGTTLIFGATQNISMSIPLLGSISLGERHINGSAFALIGFILGCVGIVALIIGTFVSFSKENGSRKASILFHLIGLGSFIVAGILMLAAQPIFSSANSFEVYGSKVEIYKDFKLTFTWVLSSILIILAGVLAIFPVFKSSVKKKKNKRIKRQRK